MTNEEAKSCIGTIEMLQRLAYNIHGVMDVIDVDNCNKIIKLLEQEPCNDAISRHEVLGIVSGYAKRFNGYIDLPNDSEVYAYARGLILSIERNINAVPPVTPQPKVGEWLKNGELCKCSRCDSLVLRSVVKAYNYCFRCGAKMEVSE